ncbi:MAG: type III secretion system export apparatus subunit SctT [Pararobbsia sp.]
MNSGGTLSAYAALVEGVLAFHTPYLVSLALAYARIAPVWLLVPFLGDKMFGGLLVRNAVIMLVLAGMWPVLDFAPAVALEGPGGFWPFAGLALREAVIGSVLGCVLALPLWICSGVGELIDNQRGATISDVFDPSNGIEASAMAAFLSLFSSAAFLANDGMRVVLEALRDSYQSIGVGAGFDIDWLACGRLLDRLVREALQLSGPVIAAMFITEALLGVLSRFAQQLNPFSLAFAVKSLVAFIVFYVYFGAEIGRWLVALPAVSLPLVPTR